MHKILIVLALLFTLPVQAQLPVAPNGKFVTVNGKKIYYEETGTGAPLLLLHGFGGTTEDWKPLVADLAKTARVIVIDLPGHGRSDLINNSIDYLHREAAKQVIALCEELKLENIRVMGFSAGAIINLYMATLKPGLTSKNIIIAGQLYFSDITRKFIESLGGPENFIMDAKELAQLHGAGKGKLIAEQFYNFGKLYGDPSFTPDVLETITGKTLIIHGDDDPVAPVENAFMMYRHIPNAHLWVIPYGGHVEIFSKDNQSIFIQRILKFLNQSK